jgi:hypothetical protein
MHIPRRLYAGLGRDCSTIDDAGSVAMASSSRYVRIILCLS